MADTLPTRIVCTGPRYQHIYYVNNGKLVVVDRDGTLVTEYYFAGNLYNILFIAYAGPIHCSHDYDGAVFYTVSYVSNDVSFIKWELDFNQNSLIPVKTKVYPKQGYYWFFVNGLTVQTYYRKLTSALSSGSDNVHINSTTNIEVGQEVLLGPSTTGTSLGAIERAIVKKIVGNIVYFKTPVLNDYKSGDSLTFLDHLICTSNYGVSGSVIPALYFLELSTLYVAYFKTLFHIKSCTCIDFNNDLLYLGSKYNIFSYDCGSAVIHDVIYSYQVCSDYKEIQGLLVWSDTELSTVQADKVEFHNFNCTTTPFNDYGTVDYLLTPFVNLIAVSVTNLTVSGTFNMEACVMDQYVHGLFNINVSIESDDATSTITCSDYNTDIYGKVYFEYTLGTALTQTVKVYTDSTYTPRSDDYVYGYCYIYNLHKTVATNYEIESLEESSVNMGINVVDSVVDSSYSLVLSDKFLDEHYTIEFVDEAVLGVYSIVSGLSTYTIETALVCDSTVRGDASLIVYQNATSYTKGPLNVELDLNMFRFLSYFKPTPFSNRNSEYSVIRFYIFPSTYKFDLTSFKVMWLESNESKQYNSGWLDITGLGDITLVSLGGDREAILFSYTKPERYFYSSVVYVDVEIYDTAPIPNVFKYSCNFSIVEDYNKPSVFLSYPECGDDNIPNTDNITIGIQDDGMGVDLDSIELLVDGISVYCTVYTVSSGILVVYNNDNGFLPGSEVLYSVDAKDLQGNLLHHTCRFKVAPSHAPDIVFQDVCGKVVDNRFSLYVDVFDTGGGVKLDSVELIINSKLKSFIQSRILHRIK